MRRRTTGGTQLRFNPHETAAPAACRAELIIDAALAGCHTPLIFGLRRQLQVPYTEGFAKQFGDFLLRYMDGGGAALTGTHCVVFMNGRVRFHRW